MSQFRVPVELRRLLDKPGFLKGPETARARTLYHGTPQLKATMILKEEITDHSLTFDPAHDLLGFGLLCFIGDIEEIKEVSILSPSNQRFLTPDSSGSRVGQTMICLNLRPPIDGDTLR